MASLIQWLKFSGAMGSDGNKVATGSAYFYVPGSVTQQVPVYGDPDGLFPLSQPVPLDAGGRAEVYVDKPCEISVSDSTGVRVALATAMTLGDLQIQVKNPYFTGRHGTDYLINLPIDLYTVLSRAGLSIGIDFKYRESTNQDCVARLVHDVLRRCISPYDYNAVGDGQADDTAALTMAINRAAATGLPLYLDVGNYRVTSGLTLTKPIHVIGAGKTFSKISTELESFDVLTVGVNSGDLSIWSLRNFSVVAPYTTNQGNKGIAVGASGPGFSSEGGVIDQVDVQAGAGISCRGSGVRVSACNVVFQGGGTAAIGIDLGPRCLAQNCIVNGVAVAGHSSIGFQLNGMSTAKSCRAVNCMTGYQFPQNDSIGGGQNYRSVADGCLADACGIGFRIEGTSGGARNCDALTCSTQESEASTASDIIDEHNSWTRAGHPTTFIGDFNNSSTYSTGNAGQWVRIGTVPQVTYNQAVRWHVSAMVNGYSTNAGDVIGIGIYIDGSLQTYWHSRATTPVANARMNLSINASIGLADPGPTPITRTVELWMVNETSGAGAFTIRPGGTSGNENAYLQITQTMENLRR